MSGSVKDYNKLLNKEGDEDIKEIQRDLNKKYQDLIGKIDVSGIYDKQTDEALRKIIKKELDSLEKNND